MNDLYRGYLVRLSAVSPEIMAQSNLKWNRDSEAQRLANDDPTQMFSEKYLKEKSAKYDSNPDLFRFAVFPLEGDAHLGEAAIWVEPWSHAEAWTGILIGEREYWGKGYGTDAMRLVAQYGFLELGMRRISLALHAFNERARKSYEKIGFVAEGVRRGVLLRDGVRYDEIVMGLLREEWLAMRGAA